MRGLALSVLLASCGMSMDEFAEFRQEKAACAAGDTCVLAGQAQCVCLAPVNAKNAAEVNDAAKDVECGGAIVSCVQFGNLRCENGTCVGDAATQ